jgi:glyoxylase-like metal-dependent hydrolase (beta-lactamase superfamily II)
MSFQPLTPRLSMLRLGMVNCYLYEAANGPILIDCGNPGDGPKILAALRQRNYHPSAVRLVATHLHIDHIGALHALQAAGAPAAVMSPADGAAVAQGIWMRPMHFAGPFAWFEAGINRSMVSSQRGAPVNIQPDASDRAVLFDELTVIATPGHTLGQISLYSPADGGILICGDAAVHFTAQPNISFLYEDKTTAIESFKRLAGMSFAVAVFGHGKPLIGAADAAFRQRVARFTRNK